ncbi:hypothetical protein BDV98DRAFT_174290 [Pterulicium gracile]|uniref:Uncharacterized protein n=1 Tax=Pterulicium gracile TaxID=1884261 RepID=A0A5C3QLI5_9AGAR|nr:hypothetical protein BDV98DRAFT_174290 [Pterula gracilis]
MLGHWRLPTADPTWSLDSRPGPYKNAGEFYTEGQFAQPHIGYPLDWDPVKQERDRMPIADRQAELEHRIRLVEWQHAQAEKRMRRNSRTHWSENNDSNDNRYHGFINETSGSCITQPQISTERHLERSDHYAGFDQLNANFQQRSTSPGDISLARLRLE